MGTTLLTKLEKVSILEVVNHSFVKSAWIVGGSLLRRDSKDIDMVVLCKDPCVYDQGNAFGTDTYKIKQRFDQYSPEDGGKDLIVKLVSRDNNCDVRPLDLLCTSADIFKGSIKEYMDWYFPLSIQRIAINVFTGEETDYSDSDNNIVLVRDSIPHDAEYIQKYMKYYPDKTFYQKIIRKEITDDYPF